MAQRAETVFPAIVFGRTVADRAARVTQVVGIVLALTCRRDG